MNLIGANPLVLATTILMFEVLTPRLAQSKWSSWTFLAPCSVTCGSGTRLRSRECQGFFCRGPRLQAVDCTEVKCPPSWSLKSSKGEWNDWSQWSTCSLTCGNDGVRTRERQCRSSSGGSPSHRSLCDGLQAETVKCPGIPCFEINHSWGVWSTWSSCSATCGSDGRQTRLRNCTLLRPEGTTLSLLCEGSFKQDKNCTLPPCPVGKNVTSSWSEWSAFGRCSATCGAGNQTRQRTCGNVAASAVAATGAAAAGGGGKTCNGTDVELKPCQLAPCPSIFHWSQWSNFSSCQPPCGAGSSRRTRVCQNATLHTRSLCSGNDTEMMPCHVQDCYSWTEWSTYTNCSAACGNGTQTRTRSCRSGIATFTPTFPPNCTGTSLEMKPCTVDACPTGGNWGNWSECNATCGWGNKTRRRSCGQPAPSVGGVPCNGSDVETSRCHVRDCSSWSQWTPFSECSVTCGNGTRTRSRMCEMHPNSDDANTADPSECSGSLIERDSCHVAECNVGRDCAVDNGGCSHICQTNETRFVCACPEGFTLDSDETNCSDVDECAQENNCDGYCINSPGSYFCLCYRTNYYWDRVNKTCKLNIKARPPTG